MPGPEQHLHTVPVTGVARDRVTGVDIRVDRVGQGRPVIFLNGLLGLNEHWFGCLAPVARHAECLLIQPPLLEMKGKGCSVDGVVHLVTSVLDTLIDQPAVFVGNSLGGHIALRIALEQPDLVRGLVLAGSSGLFERTFERDVQHSPSRDWLQRKIDALFYDPSRMLPGTVDMAYAELSRRSAARALVKLGKSAKHDHLGERLGLVTAPTQLIWGRQDIVTPPEVAEQFLALMPSSRLMWLDACGHAPHIECAEAFGLATASFIRGLDAALPQVESDSEVA